MAFSQKLNDTTQAGHAPKTDSSSELKKGKKSQIKKVSDTEPSQEQRDRFYFLRPLLLCQRDL